MLAELAAFNAAYATVKATVAAGKELSSVMSSIGAMVESKDSLQKQLQGKGHRTDLDQFMALERIKEAEDELRQLMIYAGRPGLYQDWVKFQVDARKARKEAEKEAERKRQEFMDTVVPIVAVGLILVIALGALVALMWHKGVFG